MSHDLRPGTLIHYLYLWRWQHDCGETEGRKGRPVCVVQALRHPRDDLTHLVLLAISSRRAMIRLRLKSRRLNAAVPA